MAKQGIISTAQDTLVGAAKTSVEGVKTLAGSTAEAAAGAIVQTVRRARAMVRGGKKPKTATVKAKGPAKNP